MQPQDAAYAQHVLARLTDYFLTDGVPWTRRLWDIGSVLGLEELAEACEWHSRNVLSASAVTWQRGELQKLIGPDRGIGDRELRRELTGLLKKELLAPSPQHRRLRQIIDHAKVGYLDRWSLALNTDPDPAKPERLARTLAAHLLDLGFSAPWLAQHWVTGLRREGADTQTIVESAADLAAQSEKSYDVLIAFKAIRGVMPSTWLSSPGVVAWLGEHRLSASGVRSGGGFVRTFTARDPLAAAAQGRELMERVVARGWFVRRGRGEIEPLDKLWVAGYPDPINSETPARSADVLSLVHRGQLYEVNADRSVLDDALELAAPINRGGLPGPAVAGGWAAVESMLTHPADPKDDDARGGKTVAADRLAAIVACSWPRAELTTLVHRHTGDDDLATKRDACETNHDRCGVLLDELKAHGITRLQFERPTKRSDWAAADRMQRMLSDPRQLLHQVEGAAKIAFRRLYRARNVVLHGGSTSSVALDATLRTSAPLLGAGLDRLTHHFFEEQVQPLDVAARAEVGLQLVDGETELSVIDLLQKPSAFTRPVRVAPPSTVVAATTPTVEASDS
jgi:hypothetical protein